MDFVNTTAADSQPLVEPSMERETLPTVTIDAALWEHLTARPNQQYLFSSPVAVAPDAANQLSGMIRPAELDELLESNQRFTGLAVSIGIHDNDSSMWHSQGLVQSVGSYIASLLGTGDIACRISYDEFVMIFPGEIGAAAHRRLNLISEQLWDYQLRGIGTCSILFSSGGFPVQNHSLADAIASATERMRETKRTSFLANSAPAHRASV